MEVKNKRLIPSVFGIGFLGIGTYKSVHKRKKTQEYVCWTKMLERCYSDSYQERWPTYKGCSVCKEWLNFQNFAKWHNDKYPKDGSKYHLDKDTLNAGNKIYSPENCRFITPEENIAAGRAKSYRLESPGGDIVNIVNLSKFCRDNGLSRSSMKSVVYGGSKSHKGWRLP